MDRAAQAFSLVHSLAVVYCVQNMFIFFILWQTPSRKFFVEENNIPSEDLKRLLEPQHSGNNENSPHVFEM